jgi:Transglycosylase SLT domain
MKLDLLARFSDVTPFVRLANGRSPEVRARLEDFGSLLRAEKDNAVEELSHPASLSTPVHSQRESYPEKALVSSLTAPVLNLPVLVPPSVGPLVPEQTSDGTPSEPVNTPAILEARRIVGGSGERAGLDWNASIAPIRHMVNTVSQKTGVNSTLALGVIAAESSFNPGAISSDGHGSKGLFQLLDSTGRQWMKERFPGAEYNPFNPEMNIELGMSHLSYLQTLFQTETTLTNSAKTFPAENSSSLQKLVIAAFNAGEGRVASAQRRADRDGKNPSRYDDVAPYLPNTTQTYVSRVVRFQEQFIRQNEPKSSELNAQLNLAGRLQ